MQLPGKLCGVCNQSISGRSEGEFCERCGVPVHRRCAAPTPEDRADHCPRCGTKREVIAAWEGKYEVAAGRAMWIDGASLSRHGVVAIGLGVLACGLVPIPLVAYGLVAVGVLDIVIGWRKRRRARAKMASGNVQK